MPALTFRTKSAGTCAGARVGSRRVASWLVGFGVALVCALVALMLFVGPATAAPQQVPMQATGPQCPAGMQLDASGNRCLTPHVRWSQQVTSCPSGWALAVGEFGGRHCERTVTNRVQVGTRRVFSHNTVATVWVDTGRQRRQTGTRRTWVRPRTTVEPVVPPIRRQVGTTRTWVPPATTTQVVRTGTRTERTRECNFVWELGVSVCSWVERRVPVYETLVIVLTPGRWRTQPVYEWVRSQRVTIPGYYRTVPVYGWVNTGYYDRVTTPHYRNEPVYETRRRVETAAARLGGCRSGWTLAGTQCRRVELGPPTAVPTRPPATVETSGEPPQPEVELDRSLDRSLARLATLGNSELSALGLHRCAGGLISQVPCGSQLARTWSVDSGACEGIAGTRATTRHGGSCMTGVDTLTKCERGGTRCRQVTVRTFCPQVSQLVDTRILSWQDTAQGKQGETYRACVFDCRDFAGLPAYVAQRIQSSADYHCAERPRTEPVPVEPDPTTTTSSSSTTTSTSTTTTSSSTTTSSTSTTVRRRNRQTSTSVRSPRVTQPRVTQPRVTQPRVTQPRVTQPRVTQPRVTQPRVTQPPTTTQPPCGRFPSAAGQSALRQLRFVTPVAASGAARATQAGMPGGGAYLVVAPGVGWVAPRRAAWSPDVTEAGCTWTATEVRVRWRELVPWLNPGELGRAAPDVMEAWRALSAADQQTVRSQHVVRDVQRSCSIDELRRDPTTACRWFLAAPAVYDWRLSIVYRLDQPNSNRSVASQRSGRARIGNLTEYGNRG